MLRQKANPNKYNQTKPHHPLAQMLCENYIYEHALTERTPPSANLPSSIVTPATFTAEIVFQIDTKRNAPLKLKITRAISLINRGKAKSEKQFLQQIMQEAIDAGFKIDLSKVTL